MNVKYRVELTETERAELRDFVNGGSQKVRKVKRAQVLLAADEGYADGDIAAMVCIGTSTVYRVKRRFVEGSLERALNDDPEKEPGGLRRHPEPGPHSRGRRAIGLGGRRSERDLSRRSSRRPPGVEQGTPFHTQRIPT